MGTSKIALSLPKQYYLDKFFEAGFGETTGINLMGESLGMMHDRARWSKIELATLSYGMGVAVTPLQLARFYSTLSNGGIKRPLTIIKQDANALNEEQSQRIYSSRYAAEVVGMLEHVVDDKPSNRLAKVQGYRVGGKTGTAFKAMAGGYGNDYIASFAGIAPISQPELVVVVVINQPGGDLYHGGEVAAPVFSRVMKGALRLLNIAPDNNQSSANGSTSAATNKAQELTDV
jgi:cell division protein FtsI (penicillin-binding protein 3)